MNSSSSEDIRAWLTSTGAPLEMRTAKMMMGQGLQTDQGRFYSDPDEPASIREIDVVATCHTPIRVGGATGTLQMSAVIECKHAPTPWVLYRRQHSQFGTRPFTQRLTSTHGARWLHLLADHQRIFDTPLWHLEDGPGYALATSNVVAKKPGETVSQRRNQRKHESAQDLAFKAVYAATKAAVALAAEASEASRTTIAVMFPVIVVSGQLFEAFLEGSDLIVNEVDRGKLLWSHPLADSGRVLIDIVTEAQLPQFADHFAVAGRAAMTLGQEQAQTVLRQSQPKVVLPKRIR